MDKEQAGFFAGVASGVTKLVVGHPFDTVKLRMQVEGLSTGRFKGPLDCLLSTVRKEGFFALYKGATPPLIGWMFMDSTMLGTYTNIRLWFLRRARENDPSVELLPLWQHCVAGLGAGVVVSFVATPVEQIKARLQVQYDAATKVYSGPVDCAVKLVKNNGVGGLFTGLSSCILTRHWFWAYWGTAEYCTRKFKEEPYAKYIPPSLIAFLAGGLGATVYWIGCFPADVIKNRMMSQADIKPRPYPTIAVTARKIFAAEGLMGFWRGFVPGMIRSFPTNGAALWVFDNTLRLLSKPDAPASSRVKDVRDGIVVHEMIEE